MQGVETLVGAVACGWVSPLPGPVCRWDMVVKMAHNSFFLVEARKSHTCEDRIVFPHTTPLASTVENESAQSGCFKLVRILG